MPPKPVIDCGITSEDIIAARPSPFGIPEWAKQHQWIVDGSPIGLEKYHDDNTAVSFSSLKTAMQSLELFYHNHVAKTVPRKPSTDAQIKGKLFHLFLLEHDKFQSRYAVRPSTYMGEHIDKRWNYRNATPAQKKFIAEWTAQNAGKDTETVDEELHYEFLQMAKQILDNPEARSLISRASSSEYATRWDHEPTGQPMKMSLDTICFEDDIIINLKTTKDVTYHGWRREIAYYSYHMQGAVSCDGYYTLFGRLPEYVWILVHNEFPYECEVFQLSQKSRRVGQKMMTDTIRRIQLASTMDHWRSSTHGQRVPVDTADWQLREYGESTDAE